jgi:hypothetical protein
MKIKKNFKQLTSTLTRILSGYNVTQTIGGWHLHKENIYCGQLQYQKSRGWQGSAFLYLPNELKEQLKQLIQ